MAAELQTGLPFGALVIAIAALGCASEASDSDSSWNGVSSCEPGETQTCTCPSKPDQMQTCTPSRTFSSCPCDPAGASGTSAGTGVVPSGAGGAQAGTAGMSAQQAGLGGTGAGTAAGMGPAGAGGLGGAGGASGAGAGGAGGASGAGASGTSGGPGAGDSGAAGTGSSDDPFAAERQACVDEINMYRMTLGRMPLVRGTPEQETCSDMGAKKDGDSGDAHSSAGDCDGLGAQNTCPGYDLRFGGGTIEGTLKFCLQQMWDEGEPAEGVQACMADRSGCFLDHGHWINMQNESIRTVACGFYEMSDGSYWMNQNFGR